MTGKKIPCPKCGSKRTTISVLSEGYVRGYTSSPAKYEHGCRRCGHVWEADKKYEKVKA